MISMVVSASKPAYGGRRLIKPAQFIPAAPLL